MVSPFSSSLGEASHHEELRRKMKIIKYRDILLKENTETIKNIITNHGVIIYPTDTLYGMGGNFFSSTTMGKIDLLKNRLDMPYSVIVPGLDMLHHLVDHVPDER